MEAIYCIKQAILGHSKVVQITEAEFHALEHARAVLTEALDFEQRYELLVGNFIAMEMACTDLSLRSTIERQFAYSELAKTLQAANRNFVNVLTAAKSYVDQVKQDFKRLSLSPCFKVEAEQVLSKQYDECLEYRFMEALRNHTQHHALPVTGFNGGVAVHGANDWAERLQLTVKKKELFANKKFKKTLLDGLPEIIDVRAMCREYVRRLGVAHIALRALVEPHIAAARKLIDAAISDYGRDGHPTIGLCAGKSDDGEGRVSLFVDWDDVRVQLAQKNSYPADLWPRSRGSEPGAEALRTARLACGHTIKQAAAMIEILPADWEKYESGLRVPFPIYTLYLLQTKQHETHLLFPRPRPS